jgi:DNA topoisomerase-2
MNVEEIYKKKDLHKHILDRPDTYIGSTKKTNEEKFVFDEQTQKIIKKEVEYTPAFIKIFDEILVNAIDHTVRDKTATTIKVSIEGDTISVMNTGAGVPAVMHSEYGVYIPELIFGQLLTSSNYDDTDQRIVGGVNGLGSKATNIYSKFFSVETIDAVNGVSYYQEFKDNMYKVSKPILKNSKKKPYTKITFTPDYTRFSMKGMTPDALSIIKKRTYDTSATTGKDVSVYFNEAKVPYKDFQQYTALYIQPSEDIPQVIYEKFVQDEVFVWEYAVFYDKQNNNGFNQVSFVNGINTYQGGKHVDAVVNQIIKKLGEMITSKKKVENLRPAYIKDKLFLFVKATVVNPSFSSQSKEYLSTPMKDFGSKPEVSDSFISKVYSKTGIVEDIVSFTKFKNQKELGKAGDAPSRKKSKLNIPNLEDAYNAGTSKSENCVLFLTEGMSAKTFAVSGLSVIGRENYGVWALKGKGLNVREATQKQLLNNEELNNLKQIIGLNHGKKYSDTKSLRYSKVCILTDADYDGSHIKGLIMNMFHYWWPELLDIKGFLTSMKTPMIKATSGSGKTAKEIDFYSMSAYNKWAGDNTSSKWNIKYYKGLGTSTATEAKKIFSNMKNNFVNYFSENKKSTDEAITLAFDKKMADKRKDWLKTYNFDSVLDQTEKDYSYDTFVNNELIHFSMYDVNRSIPSICDGMKPSQRKVLFTLFKRNFSKEIKVAQLGAAVAELTSYHHGEVSLFGTIINMAQDFPGSNNINLLEPNGQFGSRLALGKDAASPRYIFTELSKITKELFDPRDFEVLEYLQDDGASIEPRYYIPVIPMVLVNGCQGIGTGYSTSIPSFNPTDILENINRYLKGEKLKKMTPWFSGFTGKITPDSENDTNFIMTGVYSTSGDSVITITEIPVNTSIEDYKDFLEKIETVKDIKNSSTENKPHFIVKFESPKAMKEFLGEDPLKSLKLSKSISTRNYHLIDENGSIKKYESAEEILEQFMKIRLHTNELRKTSLIEKYSKELLILKNKINFLKSIMENKIDIYRKTKKDIEKILKETGFDTVDSTYNYLSSMPIFSFTKENMDSLENKKADVEKSLMEIKIKTSKDISMDDISSLKF